jgi:hypothetical protein
LGDASVRFLPRDTSVAVMAHLLTRNSRKSVNAVLARHPMQFDHIHTRDDDRWQQHRGDHRQHPHHVVGALGDHREQPDPDHQV